MNRFTALTAGLKEMTGKRDISALSRGRTGNVSCLTLPIYIYTGNSLIKSIRVVVAYGKKYD